MDNKGTVFASGEETSRFILIKLARYKKNREFSLAVYVSRFSSFTYNFEIWTVYNETAHYVLSDKESRSPG